MTNDDIGFGELRQFIQACIDPGEAPLLKPFLISSWVGIRALVDLLESRMADPLQEPEYLAVMQNIRQLHEYLFRLSHRKEELEKDVSEHQKKMNDNWTDALYASLMEKMHKEHNVERRIEDAQKQLEKIRDRAKSILSNHSSTVQNRTIQRLRRQLLSYTDSGHHLTSSSQIGNEKHVLIGAPVEQMPVIQLPGKESTLDELKQEVERPVVEPLQIDPEVPVKYVSWTLLESQDTSWEKLFRHYSNLSKIRREEYDFERLKFIYDFKPKEIYLGKAAFEGYVVFCFVASRRVVLECPKLGNAIYLMQLDNWKPLSQESKTELLHSYRREVRRIIHSDQWRYELECWVKHGGIPLFQIE